MNKKYIQNFADEIGSDPRSPGIEIAAGIVENLSFECWKIVNELGNPLEIHGTYASFYDRVAEAHRKVDELASVPGKSQLVYVKTRNYLKGFLDDLNPLAA